MKKPKRLTKKQKVHAQVGLHMNAIAEQMGSIGYGVVLLYRKKEQ